MNRNHGIDLSASEAHNYGSDQFHSDEALKPRRDYLAEAIAIHAGRSMMIPERKHLKAVIERMSQMEEEIRDLRQPV